MIQKGWVPAYPGEGSFVFDAYAKRNQIVLTPREEDVETGWEAGDFNVQFPRILVTWDNHTDHMVPIDYEIVPLP